MDDTSIFLDKEVIPMKEDLIDNLGITYKLWAELYDFVFSKYPSGFAEWNFPGKRYGWSYRIKDKKRAIIYFLPRESYFKVAFVFSQKAVDAVLNSEINIEIKTSLEQATKYAEGRGIRIDVKEDSIIPDIKKLIEIKLDH